MLELDPVPEITRANGARERDSGRNAAWFASMKEMITSRLKRFTSRAGGAIGHDAVNDCE